MPSLTARLKRGIARDIGLIVLGLVLSGLVLLTGVAARDDASNTAVTAAVQEVRREAYRQDVDVWRGRIAACQRSKRDRTSIAAALRAQADYLNLVLDARSVQADVKRAARVNQAAQDWSAADLESRTGTRLICARVYPRPLPPAAP